MKAPTDMQCNSGDRKARPRGKRERANILLPAACCLLLPARGHHAARCPLQCLTAVLHRLVWRLPPQIALWHIRLWYSSESEFSMKTIGACPDRVGLVCQCAAVVLPLETANPPGPRAVHYWSSG